MNNEVTQADEEAFFEAVEVLPTGAIRNLNYGLSVVLARHRNQRSGDATELLREAARLFGDALDTMFDGPDDSDLETAYLKWQTARGLVAKAALASLSTKDDGLAEELFAIVKCTHHEDDALEFLTNNYDRILTALRSDRDAVVEECARVAEEWDEMSPFSSRAQAIRNLKASGDNA